MREELLKGLPMYCQAWSEDSSQKLQEFVCGQQRSVKIYHECLTARVMSILQQVHSLKIPRLAILT